jgi:hypothetical protein
MYSESRTKSSDTAFVIVNLSANLDTSNIDLVWIKYFLNRDRYDMQYFLQLNYHSPESLYSYIH